jgi:putative intracellular protease/amidase
VKRRIVLRLVVCVVALGLAALGGLILSLPAAPGEYRPPAIEPRETTEMLAALKPPKRKRPLIAIIGINDASETTDYLMPYGILRRADIAEVMSLSTSPGPVKLYPALSVEADATVAAFDARYPEGADYVIVPAMSRDDDPVALHWIKSQASKGAIVIGVCVGVKVVAAAGLLDGRRATTHWYVRDEMLKEHPSIEFVPDRRMVVDRGVATTTGITASMPMMLTLIEAIAGHDKAAAVARDLGATRWDARHDSDAFELTRPFAMTVMENSTAFWNHERLGIALEPGIDEVSLAFVADAWSRTYRTRVLAVAPTSEPVLTRYGAKILPDEATREWPENKLLPSLSAWRPVQALDESLRAIHDRYDSETADVVAMQLEYPRQR